MVNFDEEPSINVLPPYGRLHAVWENKKRAVAHVQMYRDSGLISNMADITSFAGNPAGLEPWMKYGE